MADTNLIFRGQMQGEEVLSFTRKHWVYLLPDIIPFALYVLLVGVAFGTVRMIKLPSLNEPFFDLLLILAMVCTAYITHRFFVRMLTHFLNIVIFTNMRIVEVKKTLFLLSVKESIDMRKIQDMQVQQDGLFKNLLKFGALHIILGNTETKTISQLPNPDYFFRLINRIKTEENYRRDHRPLQEAFTGSDIPIVDTPFAKDQQLVQNK